jgi:hypothetical protein
MVLAVAGESGAQLCFRGGAFKDVEFVSLHDARARIERGPGQLQAVFDAVDGDAHVRGGVFQFNDVGAGQTVAGVLCAGEPQVDVSGEV